MKKDKEWLKEEIKNLITEESQHMPHGEMVDLELVLLTISQLEEPEVEQLDKKIRELDSYNDELIRDNNQLRNVMDNQEVLSSDWIVEHTYNHYIGRPFVYVNDLQNLLVPKQEKVVIPKFVADWIEKKKKESYSTIGFAFQYPRTIPWEVMNWLQHYDDMDGANINKANVNQEIFAKAWFDGYEVKKEKLYYIINKTSNSTLMTFELSDVLGEEIIEFVDGYSENETIHFNSKEKAELIAHFVGESLEVEEVTEL